MEEDKTQPAKGSYVPKVLWKIPIGYRPEFNRDPIKAKRDLGAEPSKAIQAFYPDPGIAMRRVNMNRQNPWDDYSKSFASWFKCENKSYPRFIHIDLAQKKDALGFAMGYRSGYTDIDNESKPTVFMDLMIRIQALKGGEIQFGEARQIIYTLLDLGFPIAQVSYDGWQSVDSIQILQSRGINATVLSVDKSIVPHDTLKSCLVDNRIDYYRYTVRDKVGTPEEKMVNIFEEEIAGLEFIGGKKVDHPAKGSKDVADAVAGVVYWCCKADVQAAASPGITLI